MNQAASKSEPLALQSNRVMDNFTLFVVAADIVMCLAFIALMVLDKPQKPAPAEPLKPAGKKPA